MVISQKEKILIIGSVGYDDIIIDDQSITHVLGGSATYGAIAASYLTEVHLLSMIGNDFREKDSSLLESYGINLEGLIQDDSQPTFRWKGRYFKDRNLRETIECQLNAFHSFNPLIESSLSKIQYVMLGNMDPDIQWSIFEQLDNSAFIVVDSIDFWIQNKRESVLKVFRNANISILDIEESLLITSKSNWLESAKKLLEMGSQAVIIKAGSKGSHFMDKNGSFSIPAYPVNTVVDPTGAGDCFLGGLLSYIATKKSINNRIILEGMLYGTACASLCIENFSINGLPKRDNSILNNRFQKLLKMHTS